MSDVDIKRIVDRLLTKQETVELVKLMKPLDVANVVAVDLGLCSKDASRTTVDLIKHAHVPRREGLSAPSIEKLPYPVPNHLDKSGTPLLSDPTYGGDDPDDVDEHLARPFGKDDITPRFDVQRHHFPPDPIAEPGGWPYDAMTVKSLKPGTKSRKKPLTMGKGNDDQKVDDQKIKVYTFRTFNPNMKPPGGDGGGGGGIYSKSAPHLRHNNMSSRGQSWDRKGMPGWSSSPRGKEFDLPESELHGSNAGEDDGTPSFMKDAPVGSSIPTMNKSGPSPGLRKGFRRR